MTEIEFAIRGLVEQLKDELEAEADDGLEDVELLADLAILECVLRRICERLDS